MLEIDTLKTTHYQAIVGAILDCESLNDVLRLHEFLDHLQESENEQLSQQSWDMIIETLDLQIECIKFLGKLSATEIHQDPLLNLATSAY